ncbi:MAG: 16S rRNA (uracil(1498)-N(3))-methyltransferase [Geminocystis sp.]|nr:16S rRNA (uracil(1498)-N(3))-methyltransferase [Geminocystis sp.]HIK37902.1 16S rRNA (uracil(1498)-N(3))-methyltransferase [Geminocystis sp. M7585_C2015_104]MCS7147004.1 16S rRNA (uracil(1498)-N(3))-methyltransferase [Geminocystis sp.]MCX8077316.1 16S rRNA (uracil(1498)-N(3))-methyltransferase [Geminocystis sp.]MDW8115828.1 16S rRNA (uracil(1498)-N(3))-methyltransferase [Geminocystis sp.]
MKSPVAGREKGKTSDIRLVVDSHQIRQDMIVLNREQEHYLRRVVRLENGASFVAIDGKGGGWRVCLTSQGAQILESLSENRELPVNVTVVVALPKGNGFDEIIRCCTELGVASFLPAQAERTLLHPGENKIQRWRKIAKEAVEQSERLIVPSITEPRPIREIFAEFSTKNLPKYIAVARGNSPHLLSVCQKDFSSSNLPSEIVVATGCEGGWTKEEIEMAMGAGFQMVSLGKRILRAITAPITAMAIISSLWESGRN